MAGLIGVATSSKEGLVSRTWFFPKITSLDVGDLKETGLYLNVNGTPTYYELVLVFSYGTYVSQIFHARDVAFYVRALNGDICGAWKRLDS